MNEHHLPFVSIGIPTFNRANSYLKQSLPSALHQIYPNVEIIVSDNCSTDNTGDYVRSFSDPRIRYFRQSENIGPNNNANFCLSEAKGHYFFLLHDDDLIDADFIVTCMQAADYAMNVGLIRTGIRFIGPNGNTHRNVENPAEGLSLENFFSAWFDGKIPMHLCGTVFNTTYLRELGGFDVAYDPFQDVAAEVQLAANFCRVDVNEIKASFRQHTLSQTSTRDIQHWIDASVKLLEKICELVPGKEALFKAKGRIFFAHHNYNLVKNIRSPLIHIGSFARVFKSYGYPWKLIWVRSSTYWAIRRSLGIIWKRLTRALPEKL